MSIYSRESEAFNGAEVKLLSELANNLTFGIATLRMREAHQRAEVDAQAAILANQAKSDFLASMSHELRTPLNSIIGFSQVLQEQYFGPLNEKQKEYVNDVVESSKHLLSLINDILDIAKIESGKIELDLSAVNIKSLLESSLMLEKEKALKHRLELMVKIAPELADLEITADERRLKQVMYNLLSNATKFTPDGGSITIEAKKDKDRIVISVSDTGIGIAPEHHNKVFEGFYQVKSSVLGKPTGTGLGLSITKQIVEMHGGKIWLKSKGLGKGTCFIITIPIEPGNKKKGSV